MLLEFSFVRRLIQHSLLIIALCSTTWAVAGPSATITGKMTDEDGNGLKGGTVLVKGTTTGALTDDQGQYSIEAQPSDVLVFSYIGYRTQEITVGGGSTINVTMEEDFGLLDEVLVVGYGSRKKSHNTGAIAQVTGKEVAAIQANRVDDALAGKLASVLIQNQDGAPGADPKIQIRATSSITGDANPLIVVDGYPISGSLATVNPNDIESIEVLKDAASAAIYGSRGANGVILVTTKKGSVGIINYTSNAAWNAGGPGAGIYGTSKAGVHTITRALAKDLAEYGIRVNAVSPGTIDTPFHQQIKSTKPEVFASWANNIMLGRLGQPEDVASVVSFLASKDAAFLTAETIQVGGGQALGI